MIFEPSQPADAFGFIALFDPINASVWQYTVCISFKIIQRSHDRTNFYYYRHFQSSSSSRTSFEPFVVSLHTNCPD